MSNNHKDEYEDFYSNSPSKSKFTVEIKDDDFEDINSFSEDFGSEPGAAPIKYNSNTDSRRRQEFSFDDPDEVYSNMIPDEPKRKKKSRHPVLKAVAVLLSVVIILTGCVGFYAYSNVKKLINSIQVDEPLEENSYISASELYSRDDQINILLVGTDAREQDLNSRSDTMILFTLDYKNNQIKLTSFLRDSYVEIARDKHNKEKLNAAYFRGGIQMLIDTLELNFKVEIPYYMIVDFEAFEKIIDKLGGITVDVTDKEAKYINSKDHMTAETVEAFSEEISGGKNHFNGAQALWYSRIRYLDSDFMRTQRQRQVISAIVKEATSQGLTDLYSLAEEILPMLRTNIPTDDIISFGIDAVKNSAYNFTVVQHSVPAEDTWTSKTISGVGSCLVLDFDKNIELLHSFLKEKQPTD